MKSEPRQRHVHQITRYLLALVITSMSFSAASFQVLPKVSDVDRKLAGVGGSWFDPLTQFGISGLLPMIKNPVHEAITLAALGCTSSPSNEKDCVQLDAIQTNRVVLYGVRWPDDPPFALDRSSPPNISGCNPSVTMRSTAQPKCWLGLFTDAGTKAKATLKKKPGYPAFGPGHYLLYRSHYGDLQFFHSMANFDGERAGDTQARMRMWAQFLWGVAIKQVATDIYIRDLGFEQISPYFSGDITLTNLFATGIVEVRKDLDKVALGVLLHMLQDSFSQAHTDRLPETGARCSPFSRFSKPGKISQFYSYARQAGSSHDHEDTFDSLGIQTLQTSPTVIDVSRDVITLWNEKASWEEASKLIDCVIDVQNAETPAGPGRFVLD
ncbi:MAG: hypothetical protein JWR68_2989 [Polaromonas sp.]|nr:hypothetical protein [Polaromonas sp.]